jgi:hypothetical protein
MPSKALTKFENVMMKDVDRIIKTHASSVNGQGKKALGHLTRAGVLLLCAAWELYIEEVLIEAVEACRERASGPKKLPKTVQKSLAAYVNSSKHELKALHLAGDGWKEEYMVMVKAQVESLNTPKTAQINNLFSDLVGIPDLSKCWSNDSNDLDDFVTVRGNVAHKGANAGYIKIKKLSDFYKDLIGRTVVETDNCVSSFVKKSFDAKSYPWKRRTIET